MADSHGVDDPISTFQAHLLSAFFAISFVGSVYVLPGARLSLGTASARHRDDAGVIRARLLAIGVSTLLSCVIVGMVVKRGLPDTSDGQALARTMNILGLYPFRAPLLSYFITPILYSGPLYALFLEGALPGQAFWTYTGSVRPLYASWISIRNYWLAPFAEEVVFRGCVLAVYILASPGASRSTKVKLIWLTPLSFGAAHVHHAFEVWHRLGKTHSAARQAMLGSLFQLAYTTLFGAHCAFLFLRTQSLWPSVVSHMWCNVMGVPQLGYELSRFPQRKLSIWAVYLLGVTAYSYGMRNWTLAEGTKW